MEKTRLSPAWTHSPIMTQSPPEHTIRSLLDASRNDLNLKGPLPASSIIRPKGIYDLPASWSSPLQESDGQNCCNINLIVL